MASAVILRSMWLLVAASSLLGCDRVRTTRECRQLSAVVESARRELNQVTGPRTVAAYRASLPLYERVASRLQSTVESSQLRLLVEDYARSVRAIAPSVEAYADALDSKDQARLEAAGAELDRAARRERLASRRLEDQCHDRF